ncbi:MAG: mandelate racemase/muconate lactonizing enzyme family protein [Peptococcaceae bacterium]
MKTEVIEEMKINSVEVIQINCGIVNGGHRWHPVLVKVNTDEGICGYGEVGLAFGTGVSGAVGLTKDFAGLLLGMDPFNTELIWETMYRNTVWGLGGGTIISAAMSGLDMALWDIKGKALGVPVYKLLGGKCREDIRVYASQLQYGWDQEEAWITPLDPSGDVEAWKPLKEPQEYAEVALKAVDLGYDCVKVDVLVYDSEGRRRNQSSFKGFLSAEIVRDGYERLQAIRDAVGPEVDIILENHSLTDVTTAIQFGRACEGLNIMYYEEVTGPLNPKLTREIKEKVNIPIAGGERIYSRWGFRPFLEERSLDVIQPDIANSGGITEIKKICDMANIYDVCVQPHVCGSPLAVAATLHLEAAIPNFIIHEHHRDSLVPRNIEICKYDYQPVRGKYQVPELPGLGQEISAEAYQKADIIVIK